MQAHFCQNISIPCVAGILEGRFTYREENKGKTGVVLCPPHPLLAGNMDNNVIAALAEMLSVHFPVLSFNYRGVGKSFKANPDLPLFEYWNNLDQKNDFSVIITDTEQLIKWSERLFTDLHLVGYSFGSYVGLSALPSSARSFTGITPPLGEHNFERLDDLSCKTLLVFAGDDNLLSSKHDNLGLESTIHEIPESDHFFIGREQDVSRLVESFLLSDRQCT